MKCRISKANGAHAPPPASALTLTLTFGETAAHTAAASTTMVVL
jgi:hypothetical protein